MTVKKNYLKKKILKRQKKNEKNKLLKKNKSLKELKRQLDKLKLNINEDEDTTNIPKNKHKKKCKSRIEKFNNPINKDINSHYSNKNKYIIPFKIDKQIESKTFNNLHNIFFSNPDSDNDDYSKLKIEKNKTCLFRIT